MARAAERDLMWIRLVAGAVMLLASPLLQRLTRVV
jgi:hypothetical protein